MLIKTKIVRIKIIFRFKMRVIIKIIRSFMMKIKLKIMKIRIKMMKIRMKLQ